MKTALVTTTIHVPHVLRLHRKHGPDVRFFVAGDLKTPHKEVQALCDEIGNAEYLSPETQDRLGYGCHPLIGWNCVQRRNIALLEALKWGAEIIISIDDDNLPIDEDYFRCFNEVLNPDAGMACRQPFNGICVSGDWFDVGRFLFPYAPHRGFPTQVGLPELKDSVVVDAKIGVAAGICLGDPDTSAVNRIANRPTVHQVSELLHAGIVVDPRNTWTVFNSQNTAIIRELAPAWFMWPSVSRYDDIFASLVVQRAMRERNYHVHFGKPYAFQQRNDHDLTRDLAEEVWGAMHILQIAKFLDDCSFPATSVIDVCRMIFAGLKSFPWMPIQTIQAGLAFLDDCEKVL